MADGATGALRMIAGFLLVLTSVFGAPLSGQEPSDTRTDSEPRIGCFRGAPLPDCRSFWLLEFQAFAPLVQTSRRAGSPDFDFRLEPWDRALEWNVGHMWNLENGRWALGGTLTAATHVDGIFAGLRVRGRRWLNPDVSVEIAPGYIRTDAEGAWESTSHGASLDLRLNIRDQGALFLRWDVIDVDHRSNCLQDVACFDASGAYHALQVGVGSGSVPALIGSGALGVGVAILLGVLIATSS